ncbi:peptide ABC transporter permease [Robertmurraya siralis]|uniref:Peptide ABC transporter permease n=1 Tax=Robertmurraya siralis TaxID=77777 RepID=A0A919WIN3_9BACI|nr:ABC transporter permease [Robertmurraya siralis]GIN62650.1 peptide ABC transporter permease [Robertmurraya siralis]
MNAKSIYSDEKIVSNQHQYNKEQRSLLIKRILSNRLMMFGSVILILLTIVAFLAPVIATQDPLAIDASSRLQAPSSEHYFGTDNLGRDLFSRVIYGTQASMVVGISVALISGFFGMVIGLYSAYNRYLDHVLMRICDGLMAFPAILLAIAIMAALGPKTVNVIAALSFVMIPTVARVIRSAALVVKEQTYIEALKSQGASGIRIIWVHIAPNTISQLIIQLTYVFAISIIIEASLSFLGVGIPAPDPSWGNIIYEGKAVIYNAWWMTVFPGMFIILAVLALNLFGDGLRDLLDPHSKK